jgi:pimeloyl-ACP methyl ester carboxylesterase
MMRKAIRFSLWAAAAVALLAACTSAPIASPPKANVVLVHGAWSNAAAWDAVAADLRRRGHSVTAVELPGHGKDDTPAAQLSLDGYVQAVMNALPANQKSVLVGHSMAGMVISATAEKVPERLSTLVYVAAYLPRNGESLYQLSLSDKDSRVGAYWTQDDPKAYSPASIRRDGIVEVFCADCSSAQQQWLLTTHKAEAVPPLAAPVLLTAARWGSVPRVYVHTRQDKAVSYALQKSMLANAGGASQVVELDSTHMPMLTQPKALADAIAAAATASARATAR